MEKHRAVVFLLLIVLGVGLLVMGLRSQVAVVSSGEQGQVLAMSELDATQEVARGGIRRDESGKIVKTYDEGQEAPAACPT